MFYVLWVSLCLIYYSFAAWLSKKTNDNPDSWLWFGILIFAQLGGVWPLVARYSKNLVFDAVLFDFILLLTYWSTLFYLGAGKNLTMTQCVALVIILGGLLLFKISGN